MKDKQVRTFLLWAFGLAWPLQLLASWFAVRKGDQTAFTLLLTLSMFAPLAAVLPAGIPLKSLGWKLRLRGNVRRYLAAWLLPSVLCALGAALYYLLFPAHFDGAGAGYLATLPAGAQQQLEAQGVPVSVLFLASVFAAVAYAPFINAIPSIGEEAGWRGFLTPRLTARFGRVKGLLLSGAIWGVWHWPVIVFAGYEYGLSYWGAPVVGPLLFCVVTTALGILLSLLYEKVGSIWICALAHGAFNAFAAIPALFLAEGISCQQILGPYAVGLIGGLPIFLLALYALMKKAPAPREEEDQTTP
ncbi:MAG: CPBP family intramembrane metalloprotease [Oscillospiraceae bacterium]|nr:CPBP family intramembrane metalloprotease [Oscillospiraceae bacterium]